ncbi:MAG: hypothetical protein WCF77_04245 [Minisyncoccia bacterium]|jgi:hypothetical protein
MNEKFNFVIVWHHMKNEVVVDSTATTFTGSAPELKSQINNGSGRRNAVSGPPLDHDGHHSIAHQVIVLPWTPQHQPEWAENSGA